MILLADIGNSRQKWALHDGSRLLEVVRFAHATQTAETMLAALCARREIQQAVVVNVGGPEHDDDAGALLARLGLPQPRFASTPADGRGFGVRVGYDVPAQLGTDRYLAMVAARARYPGSLAVVDCGTAVTFDVLDSSGHHQGGAIMPGLHLMRESLVHRTRGVNVENDAAGKSSTFGRGTADGVAIGCLHAVAGGIVSLAERAAAQLGSAPRLVLTGGDAAAVEPLLKGRYHYHPDLVLEGLAIHAGV